MCKPYDEKRAYAAFKKIMPEYDVIIHSENISCEEYYKRNGLMFCLEMFRGWNYFTKKGGK